MPIYEFHNDVAALAHHILTPKPQQALLGNSYLALQSTPSKPQ